MAWTTPITFTDGYALTASQLNTHIKENLQETMPAKAWIPGGYFVSTKPARIAQRLVRKDFVGTGETTTETDWGDLQTIGPTVICQTGRFALVWFSAQLQNSGSSHSRMTIAVEGATTFDPIDQRYLFANRTMSMCQHVAFDDLEPGENIFTCKYRVSGGTGTFTNRRLVVMPF